MKNRYRPRVNQIVSFGPDVLDNYTGMGRALIHLPCYFGQTISVMANIKAEASVW